MTVVLVAVVLGAVLGVAAKGRWANLAAVHLRSIWLLIIGAGGQALAMATSMGDVGFVFVVASYLALAAFAARNVAMVGMGVVMLGVALNLIPIVADSGMPVEGAAIVRAHLARPEEVAMLRYGAKRHLAHPGDHFRALDDTVPDWITGEVLSIGDLVIGAGVASVVAGLFRGRRGSLSSRRAPVGG